MTLSDRKKKFRIIFLLSIISLVLIVSEQLLSAFRKDLIGFDPRVAGHNFSYNFLIYFPVMITSVFLSIIALFKYFFARRIIKSEASKLSWVERISILPTILPVLGLLYFIGFIIYTIISTLLIA
jgi:uncharacterized membrane protein (DUF485 family)